MALAWTEDDPYPNVVIFALRGRLVCSDELQSLKKKLEARAAEKGILLVLDLSRIEYADSTGIGLLLHVNGVARSAGSKLRLAAATRRLLDALRLTNTDKVLTLDADADISLNSAPLR